jgi:hypothetical protein
VDGFQKGEIGAELVLTVYENGAVLPITGATGLQIHFERPDKTFFTKTAAFYTDGSDGKVHYITTSEDDLDQAGTWKAQAFFNLSGWQGHSDHQTEFPVYENTEDES